MNLGILNAINILKCSNNLGSVFRQLRIFSNVPLNISRILEMEWYFNHFSTQSRANKIRENKGTEDLPVALAWPSSAQPTGSRHSSSSSRQEDERRVAGARGHTPATSCFRRRPGRVYECHTLPHVPLSFSPLSSCPSSPSGSLPIPERSRRRRQAPPRPPPLPRLSDRPRSPASLPSSSPPCHAALDAPKHHHRGRLLPRATEIAGNALMSSDLP